METVAELHAQPSHQLNALQKGINAFLKSASKILLKPAVVTVLITALVGPFSIAWINNSLKNKEIEIETQRKNRELQTSVIQTVLGYTNSSDFSTVTTFDKLNMIAKMVDENKSVFGLTFSQTIGDFNKLHTYYDNGQLVVKNKKIDLLVNKQIEDSSKLDTLKRERTMLFEQKQKLEKRIDNSEVEKNATKYNLNQLNLKIQGKENEVNNLAGTMEINKKEISSLLEQKEFLGKKVNDMQGDLRKMAEEKQQNLRTIDDAKILLTQKDADANVLKLQITALVAKLKLNIDNVTEYQNQVSNLTKIIEEKQKMIDSLEKKP